MVAWSSWPNRVRNSYGSSARVMPAMASRSPADQPAVRARSRSIAFSSRSSPACRSSARISGSVQRRSFARISTSWPAIASRPSGSGGSTRVATTTVVGRSPPASSASRRQLVRVRLSGWSTSSTRQPPSAAHPAASRSWPARSPSVIAQTGTVAGSSAAHLASRLDLPQPAGADSSAQGPSRALSRSRCSRSRRSRAPAAGTGRRAGPVPGEAGLAGARGLRGSARIRSLRTIGGARSRRRAAAASSRRRRRPGAAGPLGHRNGVWAADDGACLIRW